MGEARGAWSALAILALHEINSPALCRILTRVFYLHAITEARLRPDIGRTWVETFRRKTIHIPRRSRPYVRD